MGAFVTPDHCRQAMGLFDNIGDQVAQHKDKIDGAIDAGGDFIDEKTGGKYAEHVDKGQDFLKDNVEKLGGERVDAQVDPQPEQ